MSRPKKSEWEKVCAFFNECFERGQNWHHVWRGRFINDRRFKKSSLTLIETYRLYLTRAGYLDHIGRGMYRTAKLIPNDLTSKECYRQAYPRDRRPQCGVFGNAARPL